MTVTAELIKKIIWITSSEVIDLFSCHKKTNQPSPVNRLLSRFQVRTHLLRSQLTKNFDWCIILSMLIRREIVNLIEYLILIGFSITIQSNLRLIFNELRIWKFSSRSSYNLNNRILIGGIQSRKFRLTQ